MADACCGSDDPPAETDAGSGAPERLWQLRDIRLAAIAAALLAGSFVTGRLDPSAPAVLVLDVAALVVAGSTFVPSALRRLVKGKIGVGTLMTIAAVGAVLLGQVGEAAALAFLFSISEGLEEYSIAKARRGLRALLDLVPPTATVRRGDQAVVVTADELVIGDIMVIGPGERVATDGTLARGHTSMDVSAITGESMPVEAGPGVPAYAGAINGNGVVDVVVTATARDNSLARIVRIVEEEQSRKGSGQRMADRVAAPLVPGILILAAIIAIAGSLLGDPREWIERALVVLVAASPCALAIAVPVTVFAAVGSATRFGVLIKGGAALEALGGVRGIALDKTGTITRNQPTVTEVIATGGSTPARVLEIAAALEAHSGHPLASAILEAGAAATVAESVTAVPGAGVSGSIQGVPARLGRPGWISAGLLAHDIERMQRAGATAVLVESGGTLLGAIAIRDELRPEARSVISLLTAQGYDVCMLTGDNSRTARALAEEAGIAAVHPELRPEDKARIIQDLVALRATAMVGDGVNDAPALATATVGIAMGAMGSDVAIETADVALMGDDLRHLPQALDHARRARRIMIQNIGLSLAIIAALMPLALLGVLGLAAVVLIHELAEILVIANGVRAGRARGLADMPGARVVEAAGPTPAGAWQ
ncbi:MAG: heavy metal translocating P-type ATPase [Candidatus Nanopelagicales bacterium]